jgi:predicted TIM-barrel fold metal-dependent hydrolase
MVLTSLIDEEFGGEGAVIEYISKNRIGAVRLFPADHNYTLNPWNTEKLFSILDKLHIPVLIEGREQNGGLDRYFAQIYEAAVKYKNIPFIMLTVGYRHLRVIYDLFRKCPNLHIDTSTFITYHGIEDVVSRFGSERILFGSRMPFLEGGVSVGRIIYAGIGQKDKENIAHGNIERMLSNIDYTASAKGEVCNE